MDRKDQSTSFSAKLKTNDRPFLDAERFRLVREAFVEERRFGNLSVGELISQLLDELRQLRQAASECACGACDGIVDPGATLEDPAGGDGTTHDDPTSPSRGRCIPLLQGARSSGPARVEDSGSSETIDGASGRSSQTVSAHVRKTVQVSVLPTPPSRRSRWMTRSPIASTLSPRTFASRSQSPLIMWTS